MEVTDQLRMCSWAVMSLIILFSRSMARTSLSISRIEVQELGEEDILKGEGVLEGFVLRVADLFAG